MRGIAIRDALLSLVFGSRRAQQHSGAGRIVLHCVLQTSTGPMTERISIAQARKLVLHSQRLPPPIDLGSEFPSRFRNTRGPSNPSHQ